MTDKQYADFPPEQMAWQQDGEDSWRFGPLERGMVKRVAGFIYFDSEHDGPSGGWRWRAFATDGNGWAASQVHAAYLVEQALGIGDDT